jgi:hypothetical protein
MGGLAVLFLLGFYCLLTLLALIYIRPIWAKAIVLILALLIPTADAVYGRYKLKQMCVAEGGLKVYRVAEHVEGFMGYADEGMITKHGYQFVEENNSPNYYRLSKESGQIMREDKVTPKSKYRLHQIRGDEKSVYRRSQYLIEDIATREILATDTRLTFKGGWAERFLAQFSDAGVGNVAWCSDNPYPEIRIENLIKSTLKK